MTAAPVVPTLQNPATGNRPLGGLFGASCERRGSMDGKGRYPDNIFIERLRRSLKYEDIYIKAYASVRRRLVASATG